MSPYLHAKVHNSSQGTRAKVTIRQHVLDAITPARAHVFDAFAGDGHMHAAVWCRAASYVGVDERWHNDARRCYAADNRRVMRTLDLSPFTIVDLDAFGSPWEQALILAARRRRLAAGEQLGLVLTDGTWIKVRMHAWPYALREASGLSPAATNVGTYALQDEVLQHALRGVAGRMGGRVVQEWRAVGVTGARMRYIGAVVEGR